ncbi:MAG: LCP family protein [Chloroflexota bacterium]
MRSRFNAWLTQLANQTRYASKPLVFLLIAFFILAGILVPGSYLLMRELGASESGLLGLLPFIDSGQPDDGKIGEPVSAIPQFEGATLPDPWDGSSRVTILIMGLDFRDWESGNGPSRSDTMILLTIDPATKTGGVLSVPRDLWANIPGFDPGKINTAYFLGEAYRIPGGGPALAVSTVEQTLGVPIDYYAQVDFDVFIEFIDLIGGVKIDVPEAITIDPIGSDQQKKHLKPGVQTLPGNIALAFARSRSTEGGDFARAARQQLVIDGIRNRIFEFDLLPGLIADSLEIYNTLIGGINTNLPLDDAIKLAVLALQIDPADIKHGIIDESYVTYGTSPDELAILIPIPDRIRTLRDEIFASAGVLTPYTPGTSQEKMRLEFASISILDGTGSVSLGSQTSAYFTDMGANIINVGVAEQSYFQTTIVVYTGSPFALLFLSEIMNLSSYNIIYEYNPNSSIDLVVKLGSDWQNSNPMP